MAFQEIPRIILLYLHRKIGKCFDGVCFIKGGSTISKERERTLEDGEITYTFGTVWSGENHCHVGGDKKRYQWGTAYYFGS